MTADWDRIETAETGVFVRSITDTEVTMSAVPFGGVPRGRPQMVCGVICAEKSSIPLHPIFTFRP
jgi:hypothetical protein